MSSTVSSFNMGAAHRSTSFESCVSSEHHSHPSVKDINVQHIAAFNEKNTTPEAVPTGYIITYTTPGNWLLGSHFSNTHTHIHVTSNPTSPTPATADTVDLLSRVLKRGFCFAAVSESPRRVESTLERDIERIQAEDEEYRGFVHVQCVNRLDFMIGKRLANKMAAGI
ncbi:hypothetical protein L198_06087 [Cryptococcus wingfieldii CBS 7118]|uniref:Uncharacterized protein n=1 Tax=Cryptococcus wingfieldii CBS 7118 TaxID=1295528 RepID=A0A1E3ISU0_9TREE|nr:hypothetical protein L198_06087 [Cryptococcus wingfieldii CBS 7118]ODN90771.1 hypothetical protein L198_06087 [Cryptococcus wingfieldii CBS 7118]